MLEFTRAGPDHEEHSSNRHSESGVGMPADAFMEDGACERGGEDGTDVDDGE